MDFYLAVNEQITDAIHILFSSWTFWIDNIYLNKQDLLIFIDDIIIFQTIQGKILWNNPILRGKLWNSLTKKKEFKLFVLPRSFMAALTLSDINFNYPKQYFVIKSFQLSRIAVSSSSLVDGAFSWTIF